MIPKEDLRWYLFEENIDLHLKNGLINYEERVISHMNKFMTYYPYLRLFGIKSHFFYNLAKSSGKDKKTILVHDYLWKYPHIINELKLNYNLIFFGLNVRPFLFSSGKNVHYPLYEIYKSVYAGIMNSDSFLLEEGYLNLKKVLRKIDPQLIVLDFDFFPETRLILLVAKELKIPTVEIQHGVYSGEKQLVSGLYADYVFVWGEYFKNLYLKSKIKEKEQIRILGYPYPLNKLENVQFQKKIMYIGQPMELYGDQFLSSKINIINEVDGLCRDNRFQFTYKPHRMEDLDLLKKELPHVKFYPKTAKIEDTIRENDIFVSFNSTALIEAALKSKICVQLKVFNIPTDDFEKLDICRSFTSLSEFDQFLKDLDSADDPERFYSQVSSDYIEISSINPGNKFIELIKDII